MLFMTEISIIFKLFITDGIVQQQIIYIWLENNILTKYVCTTDRAKHWLAAFKIPSKLKYAIFDKIIHRIFSIQIPKGFYNNCCSIIVYLKWSVFTS
jgi:hypothetical protein